VRLAVYADKARERRETAERKLVTCGEESMIPSAPLYTNEGKNA